MIVIFAPNHRQAVEWFRMQNPPITPKTPGVVICTPNTYHHARGLKLERGDRLVICNEGDMIRSGKFGIMIQEVAAIESRSPTWRRSMREYDS